MVEEWENLGKRDLFVPVSRAESCCFQCEVPVGVHEKELH